MDRKMNEKSLPAASAPTPLDDAELGAVAGASFSSWAYVALEQGNLSVNSQQILAPFTWASQSSGTYQANGATVVIA
jgi:hypothetical protein